MLSAFTSRIILTLLRLQPKAWISLAPLSGAALVAISRTMDYRRM